MRVAVDVGGTFTDVVVHDPTAASLRFDKVATTPDDPVSGIARSLESARLALRDAEYFAHGTTLALNALLTRSGARTAIIATRGFRDVYLLGRTDRTVAYDFKYHKPAPLVPRNLIYEVPERITHRGEVLTRLDRDAAEEVVQRVAASGVSSVAVCLLHSYANPVHELLVGEVLQLLAPSLGVSLSHRLTREYREYERTSTAVLDAYIQPLVSRYIEKLQERLARDDFAGRLFVIRSGGGAMTAARARRHPVELILSGPAGGVLGAASFARSAGVPNLITMDMGGTSLDASLIVNGKAITHHEASFQGLPILSASLYIETIGAGGGSLITTDAAGHLQVGPDSAGALPGPASYGRGGSEATVTDAALICGYLGSDSALAGTLRLDLDLALEALRPVAVRLQVPVEEAALGAMRIAVTKTVGAIRAVTVERGHQPSDFALLSFGGAGGLIALEVARELGIERVIVPPGPGSFSALGMLTADVQHDFAQTRVGALAADQAAELESVLAALALQGQRALREDGFADADQLLQRSVELRYVGQEHSVEVPLSDFMDMEQLADAEAKFHDLHRQRFGHALSDPVEVVTLRCRAVGMVHPPDLPPLQAGSGVCPRPEGHRSVVSPTGTTLEYTLYSRPELLAGDCLAGPIIVTEHTGTTVLHRGDSLRVGRWGELDITVGDMDGE